MRNKKEFRDEILMRYNREKRKREMRRKNISASASALCMMLVILLSGSLYLSAVFGASLFAVPVFENHDQQAPFGPSYDSQCLTEERADMTNNSEAETHSVTSDCDLPAPGLPSETGTGDSEGTSAMLPDRIPETDSGRFTESENEHLNENRNDETLSDFVNREKDIGILRGIIIGSAAICLVFACVFVVKAIKKE